MWLCGLRAMLKLGVCSSPYSCSCLSRILVQPPPLALAELLRRVASFACLRGCLAAGLPHDLRRRLRNPVARETRLRGMTILSVSHSGIRVGSSSPWSMVCAGPAKASTKRPGLVNAGVDPDAGRRRPPLMSGGGYWHRSPCDFWTFRRFCITKVHFYDDFRLRKF